ncbi:chloroplast sensor kinase, chloroplastic isoform X1 [Phragmites australis]|uniref:chloroplast sensor kinase, chloroplastic isoform X1 n=1 Tax=Phragmites australis TaxID=29695 RepID=UPI002D77931F|nr:chloroplast sensor kinase, chloroplastic isoform X1 [Phragmites australis]
MLLNTHLHLPRPSTAAQYPKPTASIPTHVPLPIPRGPLARRAHPPLRHVASPAEEGSGEGEGEDDGGEEDLGPASAAAVAAVIRRASSVSPVRFRRVRRREVGEEPCGEGGVAEPSADFRRLCAEQLEMFRLVVSREAVLSVYVRPAGTYIMDQLELRQVASYPGTNVHERDTVFLVGNFSISAGLRAAEAFLVKQQMEVIAEFGALVLPMVKHPFVIGFLVAELPELHGGRAMNSRTTDIQLPSSTFMDESSDVTSYAKFEAWDFKISGDQANNYSQLVNVWKNSALMISRTLAMAYVMDQKAYLLQQTSWQNNVRMSGLVEQIWGPLSNIRALAKMLSVHTKRSEIPYDIVEDILIQGDYLKDALQQIQDAVYLTKANIVRSSDETLKKIQGSSRSSEALLDYGSVPGNNSQNVNPVLALKSDEDDMVMPMPPLWLAPLQHQDARPCELCDVLKDLVAGALPLAYKQQRTLDVTGISHPLQVAVEESALRQALSNLIEGALLRTQHGGRVQIYAGEAFAGGALVVIDDDGPDMQYMTQMHSLAPFGSDLLADGMLEDNMTWNFIAGLTVAREILENYGCVLRVISPRRPDAVIGTGGSRIEIWLPSLQTELT